MKHKNPTLICRLNSVADEIDQVLIDTEAWNFNRSDAEPFDIGYLIVARRLVDEMIDAVRRSDNVTFGQLYEEFREAMETNEQI
jgi:hypothetical protein